MNKTIFTLVIFLAGITVAAQPVRNIALGLRLGYTLSFLSPDYTDDQGSRHEYLSGGGFRLGGSLTFYPDKRLFGQVEVLLSSKSFGDKTTFTNGGLNPVYNVHLYYLEIPISLLFKLHAKKNFFFTGGGVAPAFRSRSAYRTSNGFDLGLNAAFTTFGLTLGYTF
jgi:Outer membrane protein beta-barrel domain